MARLGAALGTLLLYISAWDSLSLAYLGVHANPLLLCASSPFEVWITFAIQNGVRRRLRPFKRASNVKAFLARTTCTNICIMASEWVSTALFVVLLVVILYFSTTYFFSPQYDAREPPVIPHVIPYVGHILGLMWYGQHYFSILRFAVLSQEK